jgi:hypothetical protein
MELLGIGKQSEAVILADKKGKDFCKSQSTYWELLWSGLGGQGANKEPIRG